MSLRPMAFKSLVGSYNYNLQDSTSDKDFIAFFLPIFDDLYSGVFHSPKIHIGGEDLKLHDIRRLPSFLWKSNVSYLEVLYSDHIEFIGETEINRLIFELFSVKKELSVMNLPYLYKACKGMHYTSYNRLTKVTKKTRHMFEKYGYNTKEAMQCYRSLDTIERFALTEFEDFKHAITYSDEERLEMLKIKYGKYTFDEFKQVIEDKYKTIEALEGFYVKHTPDEETKSTVEEIVKEIVKHHIDQVIDNKRTSTIQRGDVFYSPHFKSECTVTRYVDDNNWWFRLNRYPLRSLFRSKEIKASFKPDDLAWIRVSNQGGV